MKEGDPVQVQDGNLKCLYEAKILSINEEEQTVKIRYEVCQQVDTVTLDRVKVFDINGGRPKRSMKKPNWLEVSMNNCSSQTYETSGLSDKDEGGDIVKTTGTKARAKTKTKTKISRSGSTKERDRKKPAQKKKVKRKIKRQGKPEISTDEEEEDDQDDDEETMYENSNESSEESGENNHYRTKRGRSSKTRKGYKNILRQMKKKPDYYMGKPQSQLLSSEDNSDYGNESGINDRRKDGENCHDNKTSTIQLDESPSSSFQKRRILVKTEDGYSTEKHIFENRNRNEIGLDSDASTDDEVIKIIVKKSHNGKKRKKSVSLNKEKTVVIKYASSDDELDLQRSRMKAIKNTNTNTNINSSIITESINIQEQEQEQEQEQNNKEMDMQNYSDAANKDNSDETYNNNEHDTGKASQNSYCSDVATVASLSISQFSCSSKAITSTDMVTASDNNNDEIVRILSKKSSDKKVDKTFPIAREKATSNTGAGKKGTNSIICHDLMISSLLSSNAEQSTSLSRGKGTNYDGDCDKNDNESDNDYKEDEGEVEVNSSSDEDNSNDFIIKKESYDENETESKNENKQLSKRHLTRQKYLFDSNGKPKKTFRGTNNDTNNIKASVGKVNKGRSSIESLLGGSNTHLWSRPKTIPSYRGGINPFIKKNELFVANDWNPWIPCYAGDSGFLHKEIFEAMDNEQKTFHLFIQCSENSFDRHYYGPHAKNKHVYMGIYKQDDTSGVEVVDEPYRQFPEEIQLSLAKFYRRNYRKDGMTVNPSFGHKVIITDEGMKTQNEVGEDKISFETMEEVAKEVHLEDWEHESRENQEILVWLEMLARADYHLQVVPIEFVRYDDTVYEALVEINAVNGEIATNESELGPL